MVPLLLLGMVIGLALDAKVASLIHNGVWKWPRGSNRAMQEIGAHTPLDFLSDMSKDD